MRGSVPAQHTPRRATGLPRLALADGTVEALKWLGLVLMTLDHVNKYLLHDAVAWLYDLGRLAAPLFGFALAYNLARPGTLARGAYPRTLKRLALSGSVATVPFVALGGLGWGWWPLNIMAMLFVAAACMYLVEQGGALRMALAALLFLVGGGVVEFWWAGVAMCLAAWRYCRHPGWWSLVLWVAATAALFVINRNLWALAALPAIFAAAHLPMRLPRLKLAFHVYYPAHLAVLWGLSRCILLAQSAP